MGFLKFLGWLFVPYIMIFVSWKKLKGVGKTFGIIWAVFALLIVIGNLNSDDTSQTANAPVTQTDKKDTPKATKEPKPTEAPVELSNEGVSSNVAIRIDGVETMDKIEVNQFSVSKAQGVFKVVQISLKNGQKDAITIDSNSFTLIDDQGREFSYSTDAQVAMMTSENEPFFLTKLNPGLQITGFIAYDVPTDAKGFTIEARGGMTGKKITLKVE